MKLSTLLLAAPLLLALGTGCGEPVEPYSANEAKVKELGEENAVAEIGKLMEQAAAPAIIGGTLEVTSKYYVYETQAVIIINGKTTNTHKVRFDDVEHTEVWEKGGNWFVRLVSDGRKLDQLKWQSEGDAKDFADLVMSFRAHLAGETLTKKKKSDDGDDGGKKKGKHTTVEE